MNAEKVVQGPAREGRGGLVLVRVKRRFDFARLAVDIREALLGVRSCESRRRA